MFFSLTNSPVTFQTMMNDIFQDLIMEGLVCVYLDDILIYSKTLTKHQAIARRVLECLRKHCQGMTNSHLVNLHEAPRGTPSSSEALEPWADFAHLRLS